MAAHQDLIALAERVERLTGPDRAMDCQIAVAVGWFAARKGQKSSPIDYVDIREAGRENWPGYGGDQLVPHLTESLDAAMTLLPDGAEYQISTIYGQAEVDLPLNGEPTKTVRRKDGNVVLAFVECCLKARAASGEQSWPVR